MFPLHWRLVRDGLQDFGQGQGSECEKSCLRYLLYVLNRGSKIDAVTAAADEAGPDPRDMTGAPLAFNRIHQQDV